MCTITLQRDFEAGSLLLTMNRDERLTRGPEIAPEWRKQNELPWLGPLDSDAGGSWCALNAAGVVACIMNDYGHSPAPPRAEPHKSELRSRGLIIPWLLSQSSADEARRLFDKEFNSDFFAPFYLLLADAVNTWHLHWPGAGSWQWRDVPVGWSIFSSSSWHQDAVRTWRKDRFRQWLLHPTFSGPLPAFHLLQPEKEAASAPRMRRDNACTRSITQIEFDFSRKRGFLRYWGDPAVSEAYLEIPIDPSPALHDEKKIA